MANRTLVWTLAALAVVLVLVPLLGVFGMMSMHWMAGGMMMGMSIVGTLWVLFAIIVIAAFVALLLREASKT